MFGKIIYDGPSLINGRPIVAIATVSLANRKVGHNLATYILAKDVPPVEAVKTGEDRSVCGDCVHRGTSPSTRSCYVLVFQGPLNVWNAYKRGTYGDKVTDPAKITRDFMVRLGTYGDPCAVPKSVWDRLLEGNTHGHTGYTHNLRFQPEMAGLVQVSADTERQAEAAHKAGLRTFRTRLAGEPLLPGEVQCPASVEAGKKTTCSACKLCNGQKKSVSVLVHGSHHLRRNFVLNLEKEESIWPRPTTPSWT
jgi:hypothetical protein